MGPPPGAPRFTAAQEQGESPTADRSLLAFSEDPLGRVLPQRVDAERAGVIEREERDLGGERGEGSAGHGAVGVGELGDVIEVAPSERHQGQEPVSLLGVEPGDHLLPEELGGGPGRSRQRQPHQ